MGGGGDLNGPQIVAFKKKKKSKKNNNPPPLLLLLCNQYYFTGPFDDVTRPCDVIRSCHFKRQLSTDGALGGTGIDR